MKKLLSLCLLAVTAFSVYAQTLYVDDVYSNVTVTTDVKFGEDVDRTGNTQDLLLDIYSADGAENLTNRPVIVFSHEGSFLSGDKSDNECVSFANRMARKGYLVINYNYRLGWAIQATGNSVGACQYGTNEANSREIVPALWRGIQDGKAAMRWVRRMHAENPTTFNINPDMIFHGGFGAGAYIPVNAEFFDTQIDYGLPKVEQKCRNGSGEEVSNDVSYIDTIELGGFNYEGGGSPGFDWRCKAVLNFAGALGDTNLLNVQERNPNSATGEDYFPPMITVQGTDDQTTPFGTAIVFGAGTIPIIEVSGGYEIARIFDDRFGVNSRFDTVNSDGYPIVAVEDPNFRFADREIYRSGTYPMVGKGYQPWAFDNGADQSEIDEAEAHMDTLVEYVVHRLIGIINETPPAPIVPGCEVDTALLDTGFTFFPAFDSLPTVEEGAFYNTTISFRMPSNGAQVLDTTILTCDGDTLINPATQLDSIVLNSVDGLPDTIAHFCGDDSISDCSFLPAEIGCINLLGLVIAEADTFNPSFDFTFFGTVDSGAGPVAQEYNCRLEQYSIVVDSMETIGIDELNPSIQSSLVVYPNPTNGSLNIKFDYDKFEVSKLHITNMNGQKMMEMPINTPADLMNIDFNYETGLYFVIIELKDGSYAYETVSKL